MELASKNIVENCKCKDVPVSEISNYEDINGIHMKKLMSQRNGIGLASPQVGIFRNMFIMKYGNEIISCYNPTWVSK